MDDDLKLVSKFFMGVGDALYERLLEMNEESLASQIVHAVSIISTDVAMVLATLEKDDDAT